VAKCAIIVFNESKSDFNTTERRWLLGDKIINETTKYTHIGIACNKYFDFKDCIRQTCTKLLGTFLSLIKKGLCPGGLILCKLYKSVVLPKGLYGCEFLNSLSNTDILALERAHRYCIKFMQKLPTCCSTDFALSAIGLTSIASVIKYRKLLLFGQLCRLPTEHISKQIFLHRLVRYLKYIERQFFGFIQDVCDILSEYDL